MNGLDKNRLFAFATINRELILVQSSSKNQLLLPSYLDMHIDSLILINWD